MASGERGVIAQRLSTGYLCAGVTNNVDFSWIEYVRQYPVSHLVLDMDRLSMLVFRRPDVEHMQD